MSGTIGPLPPPRRFNGPQAVSPSGRRLPLSSKIPEAIRTRILAHVTTFLEQRLETSLSFGLFSIGLAIDLLGQIGEIAELDLLDRLLASLEQELGVAAQKVRLAQVKIATQHDSPKAQTYQEKLILKYEEILAGAARGSGLGDAKTFLESLKLLLYYFSADQSNRFKGIYIRLKSLDDRIRMIKATGVEPKEHMAFALVIGLLGDRDEALRHCAEIMGLWNVAVKAKSARLEYYFVMSDNIPLFARYLNKLVAMEGKEERLTQTEGAIIAGFSNFADKLGDLPLVYTEAVAEFFSSPDDNALRMAAFARLRSILECDDRGTTEMKEALAVIDDLQLNALLPDLIKIKESLSAADFREYHKINFICALAGALARLGKTTQALELLNRIISVPGNLINKAAIAKAAGKCGTTAGLTLLEKIASQANDFILGLSFLVENWRGESRQQPTVPNPLYEQAESLAKLVLAASQKARPEVGSASGFANQGIHRSAPQKGRAAASHGFDFRNMRKLYVGDSVGHGRLVYRGDDVYEAEFETTQASPAMVVVDPRLLEGNRKKVALTAGAIAGVNYRNQDPVGLMIGTGEGGGAVKPQREKGLSHIIFKILNGAANKPSLLEMLDRAYAHVPDGGRVYLVANFAEQAELLQPNAKGETKLGRSIAGRRAKQITVIPVQYGVDVFPSFEMQIGQHKFAVNDVVARKMSDVGDNLKTFLSKHQGIAVESLCTSEIMLQKTIAAAAQPGVDLPAFDMTILEPAEVIPVESTSPAPRHMIKLLSWAIKNNNRLLVAKILFCAKVFGWVEIFDWLEARLAKIKPNNAWRGYFYLPSHPTPRAQGDLGPTQQSVNVLIFNDAFSLTPLKVASLWGKKIEQKDSDKILNGFIKEATPESVLPFQTALNKACARNWSDIITLEAWGYDVDKVLMGLNPKANRMAQLGTPAQRQHLAKTNISSPAQSGAREEKKGDHHNWLSVERRLAGRDIYLLGMVVGEWDAAHCQHREIPGLGLEAIQLGGGEKVTGRRRAEISGDIPAPAGGRIVEGNEKAVTFELGQIGEDISRLTLKEVRERADNAGTAYQTASQAVPLESLPQEMRDFAATLSPEMTVRQVVQAIRRFIFWQFRYAAYKGSAKADFEALIARAERGEATGAREYLDFILKHHKGKCQELSEVALNLLRSAGIPAVKCLGYVARERSLGHILRALIGFLAGRKPWDHFLAALSPSRVDSEAHAVAAIVLPDTTGRPQLEPVEVSAAVFHPVQTAILNFLPRFVMTALLSLISLPAAIFHSIYQGIKRLLKLINPVVPQLPPPESLSQEEPLKTLASPPLSIEAAVPITIDLQDEFRQRWQAIWESASDQDKREIHWQWRTLFEMLEVRDATIRGESLWDINMRLLATDRLRPQSLFAFPSAPTILPWEWRDTIISWDENHPSPDPTRTVSALANQLHQAGWEYVEWVG